MASSVWARYFFPGGLAFFIALSGSLVPAYFLKSVEFRPDDLWAAVWFLSVAVLIEGQLTVRRAFWFGLGMGVSFAVSMKTTLFVLTLVLALAILLGLKLLDKKARLPWMHFARCIGVAILGMLVAPAVVVAYFALHGILPQFYYGVIEHNIVPGMKRWNHPGYLQPWFVPDPGRLDPRGDDHLSPQRGGRPAEPHGRYFSPARCYALVLFGFWPDIPREDDLPLYPLIPLALCLLGSALLPKLGREPVWRFATRLAWVLIALQISLAARVPAAVGAGKQEPDLDHRRDPPTNHARGLRHGCQGGGDLSPAPVLLRPRDDHPHANAARVDQRRYPAAPRGDPDGHRSSERHAGQLQIQGLHRRELPALERARPDSSVGKTAGERLRGRWRLSLRCHGPREVLHRG
ncbi:MAG: hypothetical protein WDN28_30305 [Chthoniobacter sp.]